MYEKTKSKPKPVKPIVYGNCIVCNNQFEVSGKHKKYCCKTCREIGQIETKRLWRENNVEAKRQMNKNWRDRNVEHCKDYAIFWAGNNKERVSITSKAWKENNKERVKENHDRWVEENPEKSRKKSNEWKSRNRDQINEQRKRRWHTDPSFKLSLILRSRLTGALMGKKKLASFSELLGCTAQEARDHIESQFQEGMTWENHGLHTWHVDHVIPFSSWDLNDLEQQKKACHFSNLQPLFAFDNLSKNDRLDWEPINRKTAQ